MRLRRAPVAIPVPEIVVVQGYMAPRYLKKVVSSNFSLALLTFFLINVTWVFFRSTDFTTAWRLLNSMFLNVKQGAVLLSSLKVIEITIITILTVACHWMMRNTRVLAITSKMSWWVLGLIWSGMLILLILCQESSGSFIYFQF